MFLLYHYSRLETLYLTIAGASKAAADDFMTEFQTMSKIGKHPNIVGLLGVCLHEGIDKRYWQNKETATAGLDSSVGRAPARQSGGRRFKSRSI